MTTELYLAAQRKHLKIIDDKDNRFPKYVHAIRALLEDFDLDVIFVRSQECQSEIKFGDPSCVIIDRQTDLYLNALAFPEVFSKESDTYGAELWCSYCYIAASELMFAGYAKASEALIESSGSQSNFNQPVDFMGEMSRLHFAVMHEDGHNYLARQPDERSGVLQMVRAQFVELFGELSFLDPRVQAWTEDLQEECAVDYYSLVNMTNFIKDDPMASGSMGGPDNFSYSSLVNIHQLSMVRRLQNRLKSTIFGKKIDTPQVDPITLRLRITRQLFNRLNVDNLGVDRAKSIHEKFDAYLARTHKCLGTEFPDRLTKLIPSLINGEESSDTNPFCNRFKWQ